MKGAVKLIFTLVLVSTLTFSLYSAMKKHTGDSAGNSEEWIGKPAPELSYGEWINSNPLKLSELRGQVVLIEFWTFGCYNCRNTIPYVNRWQKKYGGESFKIIGVHTPEFRTEKIFSRVKAETAKLGIEYAVVTDNDYRTWNAYEQQFWPVVYLVDKKGIIRYVHIGEGNYDKTEATIQSLLAEK